MKQRIFITMHYMELGGAEISLIGLLNSIDRGCYDVDLFLHCHRGELMELIPEWVNLLPEVKEYAYIERPIAECLKVGCWKVLFGRLKAKWMYRKYAKLNPGKDGSAIFQMVGDAVTPGLPSLEHLGTYDLAISFLTPHNIVLDKVKARKRIAWIHTDYSCIDVDVKRELKVWGQYDYIASISEKVTETFLMIFPLLKDKIVLIENILSSAFVIQRSQAFTVKYESPEDAVNLLTVGRFSPPKNQLVIPSICQMLRKQGLNVYWYLIGYGGEEDLLRRCITEAGMEEYVKILGKMSNPYPYMVACHIYVQPSKYEGKCVSVREAQILCKPVIVTNYPTASSQIASGVDGVIVPLENEACAMGIAQVVNDAALQEQLIQHLQTHDYGNEQEVEKIYELINN